MKDARLLLTTRDLTTADPAPFRGIFSELFHWVCSAYLKLTGWKIRGDWPVEFEKMVLVAAPHTSNWDGINMIAAAGYYRVKLRWIGKKSLTAGPFGWLVKALGCVPIDRKAGGDVVAQMTAQFASRKDMVLAVAPEGTRSHTTGWKTGFYHMAVGAGVPIVMSVLDYGTKTISLPAILHPTGAIDEEIKLIRSQYRLAKGKIAEKFQAPEDV